MTSCLGTYNTKAWLWLEVSFRCLDENNIRKMQCKRPWNLFAFFYKDKKESLKDLENEQFNFIHYYDASVKWFKMIAIILSCILNHTLQEMDKPSFAIYWLMIWILIIETIYKHELIILIQKTKNYMQMILKNGFEKVPAVYRWIFLGK